MLFGFILIRLSILSALNHLRDFVCEILFSLLKTFALFENNERYNFDVLAEFLGCLSGILADCEFVVLYISLFNKANSLIELAESAADHLFENGVGFACVLGIVLCLLNENRLFFIDFGLRNFVLIYIFGRVACGNLKCDVLRIFREFGSAFQAVVNIEFYNNACGAVSVNVCRNGSLNDLKAAD